MRNYGHSGSGLMALTSDVQVLGSDVAVGAGGWTTSPVALFCNIWEFPKIGDPDIVP